MIVLHLGRVNFSFSSVSVYNYLLLLTFWLSDNLFKCVVAIVGYHGGVLRRPCETSHTAVVVCEIAACTYASGCAQISTLMHSEPHITSHWSNRVRSCVQLDSILTKCAWKQWFQKWKKQHSNIYLQTLISKVNIQ